MNRWTKVKAKLQRNATKPSQYFAVVMILGAGIYYGYEQVMVVLTEDKKHEFNATVWGWIAIGSVAAYTWLSKTKYLQRKTEQITLHVTTKGYRSLTDAMDNSCEQVRVAMDDLIKDHPAAFISSQSHHVHNRRNRYLVTALITVTTYK